jgi:hypothetical protein
MGAASNYALYPADQASGSHERTHEDRGSAERFAVQLQARRRAGWRLDSTPTPLRRPHLQRHWLGPVRSPIARRLPSRTKSRIHGRIAVGSR